MKVELDKAEIYGLLESLCPPYEWMDKYSEKGYGYYVGGFNDNWYWDISEEKLKDISEEDLYQEYVILRDYWRNKKW